MDGARGFLTPSAKVLEPEASLQLSLDDLFQARILPKGSEIRVGIDLVEIGIV
jgi:hypothetical protein